MGHKPKGATTTVREQLEQVYIATGKLPPELAEENELPACLLNMWRVFCDLNAERQSNCYGLNPLSSPQIVDWCKLNRVTLSLMEVRLLREADAVFLREVSNHD